MLLALFVWKVGPSGHEALPNGCGYGILVSLTRDTLKLITQIRADEMTSASKLSLRDSWCPRSGGDKGSCVVTASCDCRRFERLQCHRSEVVHWTVWRWGWKRYTVRNVCGMLDPEDGPASESTSVFSIRLGLLSKQQTDPPWLWRPSDLRREPVRPSGRVLACRYRTGYSGRCRKIRPDRPSQSVCQWRLKLSLKIIIQDF